MNGRSRKDDDTSLAAAVDWLNEAAASMRTWVESVRPPGGERGRFLWARRTTRPANCAATSYILGGINMMGAGDVITDQDRRQGIAWVQSFHGGHGQYRDPAILERRPPDWPAEKPYPDPPLLVVINQYSLGVLRGLGFEGEMPRPEPPDGIPQAHEADKALEYVRTRPWNTNPWGAGSHSMRMATWLLNWHQDGRIPLDPLIDVLRWIYSQQDPQTGLWGAPSCPKYERINGTFKLFPLICENLRLPLPHADKIIEQVLAEWDRPDYDENVGACDEWDNWYVIANCMDYTDHRADDIRAMALRRLNRMHIFQKPDGGMSYHPAHCATAWCGVDMAPPVAQSDCMGLGILKSAIAVCVGILGLEGQTAWSAKWRMREPADEALCNAIRERLGL